SYVDFTRHTEFVKVLVLPSGDAVVVGRAQDEQTSSQWRVIVARYHVESNGSLTQVWTTDFAVNKPTNLSNYATHAMLDPDGNIVIAGYVTQTTNDRDYLLLKLSPSGGAPIWTATYSQSPGSTEEISDLGIDRLDGSIYLTGRSKSATTGQDYATVK